MTPTLPTWASPPVMMQPLSATSRVMKIGLSSDELSIIDLSMIAYWNDPRAAAGGARRRERGRSGASASRCCRCRSMPERLAAHGVSLDEVMEATADALDAGILQFSDGDVDRDRRVRRDRQPAAERRATSRRSSRRRTSSTVTLERPGRPGRCASTDVAELVIDHQPLIGDAVINDGPGLMLIVEKFPWANTLDVTRGRRGGARRAAPRPHRHRDRHDASSGRRPSSRWRSTT